MRCCWQSPATRSASASRGRRSRTARSASPNAARESWPAGWRGSLPPKCWSTADAPDGQHRFRRSDDDHAPPAVAVRRRPRQAQAVRAAARRHARRVRRRRARRRARRRRRAARLRRAHAGARARARAPHLGAARERADRPAAGHAPQPRADEDAARRDAPTLLSTIDTLRHRHGQPRAAPLADAAAARAARRDRSSRRDRDAPRRPARRAARSAPRTPPTSSGSAPASPCARCARASSPACARRSSRCRRCARRCPPKARCSSTMLGAALAPPDEIARAARRDRRRARRAAARRRRHRRRPRRRARRAARDRPRQRRVPDRARGEASARAPASRRCASSSTACTASSSRSRRRRRDKRAGRLPAPPDDEERRALHHARAEGVRGQGAVGRRARAGARDASSTSSCSTRSRRTSRRSRAVARSLASLDALAALAEQARRADWCRPRFVKEPLIEIERGRHPVVEARLQEDGKPFIANDCRLDSRCRMLVITGPNMGGKSTFMRQVALIVLLASIGSYVPAAACRLGPIDAIHTRIGAADDLANAQSTFMVEMTEAATIVHCATEHSLVLMDEIGRGTSTFDGLALAGAIAHHLHEKNRAFTLFATHYFELTEFPLQHARAKNVHVAAVESGEGNEIAFLHEIEAGPASRSYGVQVARLAGMPPALLRQARAALERARGRADRTPAADRPVRRRAARGRRRAGDRGRRHGRCEFRARGGGRRARPRYPLAREKRSKRCTVSRHCNEIRHDLLRSRQARRRTGLPLRLAHQRRARPDRHLPQDDGLRASRRPLHGDAVGRQPVDLAAGARDPADRRARRRRPPADHDLERDQHVRRRARPRRRGAPRLRPGRRVAQEVGARLQRVDDLRRPDPRRGDAALPRLLGGQLHRGDARDVLLPDRRVEVRQARARPHDAALDAARRGGQVRAGVDGLDA